MKWSRKLRRWLDATSASHACEKKFKSTLLVPQKYQGQNEDFKFLYSLLSYKLTI